MIVSAPAGNTQASEEISLSCQALAKRARNASRLLAMASSTAKNQWLELVAESLENHAADILQANALDLDDGLKLEVPAAFLDRLRLTKDRLRAIADGVRSIEALADPAGRVLDTNVRPTACESPRSPYPSA
jgi:glutamate-5-semialdehyde dehydrogenase